LDHPLDDFLEVVIEGPNDFKIMDAIMDEITAIVWRFGGYCNSCGPLEPGL
jgi:hypothetical protein